MPPICPRIQLFGMGLGQLVSIWNFGSSAEACTTIASAIAPANAKVRPNLAISPSCITARLRAARWGGKLPSIGRGDNQGKGGGVGPSRASAYALRASADKSEDI